MFSVKIPDLTNTDSREMRKLMMQFMRETNLKIRTMEQYYDHKIKELEKRLRTNGE